ncbi:FkbM family methyltransferase [Halomonas daqingensis]|uniref:FkbM family methyltransferase n=1 Tax=Billgrantia desiderata TaxID=52021 RepID=A0AAW4YR20_9GAMM|nr:FkbM family methyltransferase [Halomonas desiderata]MCE8014241.1 FkbM family methyltransferase [Halomonas desiderata]MCE8050712.1 FkbM family methyltransferase [Halomonas desiderata]
MSLISYAQNFEDVMLWRVFKNVDSGCYIDIGAQDPVVDSVSLVFYEHGWSGVHVEPTQQYSDKLRHARPSDFIEQLVIGNGHGSLTFYEFPDTGLSTADPEVAKHHQSSGFIAIRTQVEVVSLDFILDKYGFKTVHWLKIDVEGFEKSVLESWRTSAVRPWVLIIESTRPLSQQQSHDSWESLVFNKGYCFAYFDGLNRFYVHQDHYDLLDFFTTPPNIFDGFVLSGTASHPFYQRFSLKAQQAEAKAQQAEAKAQQAEAKAQQAEAKAQQAEAKAQHAENKLCDVYYSRSWRITAPLRWVAYQLRLLRKCGVKVRSIALIRKIGGSAVRRIFGFINARPTLRHKFVVLAHKLGAYNRLRKLYHRFQQSRDFNFPGSSTAQNYRVPSSLEQLTPRAREIYDELLSAIEHRNKDQA